MILRHLRSAPLFWCFFSRFESIFLTHSTQKKSAENLLKISILLRVQEYERKNINNDWYGNLSLIS